jgi:hypothetical protein
VKKQILERNAQFIQTADRRSRKRIALPVHDSLAEDRDLFQQRKLPRDRLGSVSSMIDRGLSMVLLYVVRRCIRKLHVRLGLARE